MKSGTNPKVTGVQVGNVTYKVRALLESSDGWMTWEVDAVQQVKVRVSDVSAYLIESSGQE